ncbi:TPA: hypothetical protein DEQ95_02895 [Candidatus Beckwithbacteria bacterium]|jgi:hypothetical protein|nr:hypothetical protein [Candidatus Beckwithbacteria bacterium]HCE99768.1 hypothetical protein [Candidatus Beckwithbacteria bacterium]HCM44273.1 hypothetical protein [Candidatus Beckwithbacteria bacterium]
MTKKPANQGKQWSPTQESQLRKLARGNTPTRVIGLKMSRTPGAIQAKAQDLNVSLMPHNRHPYNRSKAK